MDYALEMAYAEIRQDLQIYSAKELNEIGRKLYLDIDGYMSGLYYFGLCEDIKRYMKLEAFTVNL